MKAEFKEFIESLAHPKGPGPSTTFSIFHIFYVLEILAERPMGRTKLAEKLNVGEGAVRTIISHLKDAGLIVTSKKGCSLTDKGLDLWEKIEETFPKRIEVERTRLTSSENNYAFLVKNRGHKVKSGIDQRDAAIMGGATRAVAIVSKNGHLVIESVSTSIKKDFPEASNKILKGLKPEDNDVVIIAGADSPLKAKRGAFAASWALLTNKKKT